MEIGYLILAILLGFGSVATFQDAQKGLKNKEHKVYRFFTKKSEQKYLALKGGDYKMLNYLKMFSAVLLVLMAILIVIATVIL